MPALNSGQVRVAGTGAFWKAPLGTVIPTDSTTAWNAAFVNLGYATDGFEVAQDRKTSPVMAWQTLEAVRLIATELTRKFKFELLQTNKSTLGYSWSGVVIPSAGTPVGGAITIGTGGVLTSATPHGLSVGSTVQLATVVTSTGITALTVYYVTAVTSLTATLSAIAGGAPLTTTAGTGTGLALAGGYQLDLLEANNIPDCIIGIDWSDGVTSQRIIIQQASVISMPTIKNTRTDAVRYAFEIQAIKPSDGTDSVLIYGNDVNALV